MRRILALLSVFLALSSPALAQQSETLNQLPAAGTITNTTPIFGWQGGQSVQTTAGAIAALGSSTSGTGIPGGLSTQPQFNNGGNFGGLKEYYVQAYGAYCDGTILYSDVRTTNGSAVISSPDYTFTTADVGAHITLTNPAAFNTYYQSGTFDGTIISVSGGNATLSGNVGFTSTSYAYASARFYHHDDSVAIQNALTAAATAPFSSSAAGFIGGGAIRFPGGVCVGHNLVFYSNETIEGDNVAGSTVMLAANSNSDLFISYNFASLAGTGSGGGAMGWNFQNITLDGNRGSNAASGIGTASGYGDGIRAFGANFGANNLHINFFPSDCAYTEWGSGAGVPSYGSTGLAYADGLESFVNNYYGFYCGGWAWVWNGSHDSNVSNFWSSGNNTGGLINTAQANGNGDGSPLHIFNFHGYSEGPSGNGPDLDFEAPYAVCYQCDAEGSAVINTSYVSWFNSDTRGTLTIGKSGTTGIKGLLFEDAVGTQFFGLAVPNLVVTSGAVADNGATDTWINMSIGSISGTYKPNIVENTPGFGYQQLNVNTSAAGPLQLANCATSGSFACSNLLQLNATTSYATLANTTTPTNFMLADNSQNVAFGPGIGATVSGVGADFHSYSTSSNSSLSLPQGTTVNRPSCGGSTQGAIRFNTTNDLFEGCLSSGSWANVAMGSVLSTSVVNTFTAGQVVTPVAVSISTSTFTPNLSFSNNFTITLVHAACPCTIANPPSVPPGQSGMIFLYQSGSGNDTIGTWGSDYVFSGGSAPTLSTGANALNILSYVTLPSGQIAINPSLNFHN